MGPRRSGGFLAWPHSVTTLTNGIPLVTYHNQLGASGMAIDAAVGSAARGGDCRSGRGPCCWGGYSSRWGAYQGSEIGVNE